MYARRMFNQQELQILLGGVNAPIDLEDLRRHTQYGGLYNDHEQTIELFWEVRRRSLSDIVRTGLNERICGCAGRERV